MVHFFKLRSTKVEDQIATGKSIIAISDTVFSNGKDSEWNQFNSSPRAWVSRFYDYCDAADKKVGDGSIPPDVVLVPVYDTPTHMHVRIPWRGDLKEILAAKPGKGEEEEPGGFPAELARYFLRKCR